MKLRIVLLALLAGILLAVVAMAAHARSNKAPPPPRPESEPIVIDCSADTPFGLPTVPGSIHVVCKTGYLSYYDTVLKVPRFLAYSLSGDQTLGCLGRYKNFHAEQQLGSGEGAVERDYVGTNYDLGHNASDQDMASDLNRAWDSFSMVNIAPQKPKFNREGWESLEQNVRDWAWKRGEVIVYVGSIFTSTMHNTIGAHQVAIPEKFYKIVIDPKTDDTIAFVMANVDTPKGDMSPFRTSVQDVENQSGIVIPLPDGVDKTAKPDMWPIDDRGWHQEHKRRCHSTG